LDKSNRESWGSKIWNLAPPHIYAYQGKLTGLRRELSTGEGGYPQAYPQGGNGVERLDTTIPFVYREVYEHTPPTHHLPPNHSPSPYQRKVGSNTTARSSCSHSSSSFRREGNARRRTRIRIRIRNEQSD